MANRKIFFSYSRVDGSAFAIGLATDLKKKGFDVWIDQEDIRAGLEWDTEIEKALETCDTLLFLGTEKSVVSNNVLDEVYYALEQQKKVIPLIFVNSKMPFRLNRLQHIDFTRDYDAALLLLVNELEGNTPAISCTPEQVVPAAVHNKPFFARNKMLVIAAGLAVLIAATFVFLRSGDGITNGSGERDKPGSAQAAGATTLSNPDSLLAIVEGKWSLTDVEPKAAEKNGYLHIEASGEGQGTIKAYMQFYYPDSKGATSLSVFNAFAGCSTCIVKEEMKLNVEDISVSSRSIKRAQENQADGKKAGDTISDASATRSIYGTASLQFVDGNNATVVVKQTQTIELTNELKLEPFEYRFHFKKKE
jgi:hypothetical protein